MRRTTVALLVSVITIAAAGSRQHHPSAVAQGAPACEPAAERIIAVAIPGASALAPVGRFLPGGPIHDKPEFAAFTEPGRILHPSRLLVTSSSNFGAPLADPGAPEGALLSIDSGCGDTIVVPPAFAARGGQASALDGRVQLFAAQSPAFVNAVNNPGAVTAPYPAVSNPNGLSINNAFGRIWPTNAPNGVSGAGSVTVLDPTGAPLASPPNPNVGGVFAGDLTGRQPKQLASGGLMTAAIATAFLGKSTDDSGRAVFAIVLADGSLVQAHTEQGVDGLAPPGTVAPLVGTSDLALPVGMVLNFEPLRILYITEAVTNSVVALTLADDGHIFSVDHVTRLTSPSFDQPIAIAAAKPETEDTDWASNTTLQEFSDLYVLNRGNSTIVRMTQEGAVLAERRVTLPGGESLGAAQVSGIAVSPDGRRIWVTLVGALPGYPGSDGAVIELPAFG